MDDFATCCLHIMAIPAVSLVLIALIALWDYCQYKDEGQ